MGRVVPVHNATALADAIIEVLHHPDRFRGNTEAIRCQHDPMVIAEQYENIFNSLSLQR
jgi:glycosyltransferase involved in cell wall biosynthesis